MTRENTRPPAGRRAASPRGAVLRARQLRDAKRAQRARQRAQGVVQVELQLPQALARKLVAARRDASFQAMLEAALDRSLVRLEDYPQLCDIAWNRRDTFIPAGEAFALYERNWRFIDVARMCSRERELLTRLVSEFGNGVINA